MMSGLNETCQMPTASFFRLPRVLGTVLVRRFCNLQATCLHVVSSFLIEAACPPVLNRDRALACSKRGIAVWVGSCFPFEAHQWVLPGK